MAARKNQPWIGALIYLLTGVSGAAAFLYPFFQPGLQQSVEYGPIRSGDMAWLSTFTLVICLVILLYEIQSQAVNLRLAALLGMLVAINSALRFAEIAIPGPGGFSPVFFLILVTGWVFGGRIGFLMGALTLLVSALVTGGVGPWLPGQMFTAGWVGMSAPLLRPLVEWIRRREGPDARNAKAETAAIGALVILGALWGLLYGAIMDLWAWPFLIGPQDQYWTPGVSAGDTLARFGVYYLATSLVWDLARSAGNVLLLVFFGAPTLRALERFKLRFSFEVQLEPAEADSADGASSAPDRRSQPPALRRQP